MRNSIKNHSLKTSIGMLIMLAIVFLNGINVNADDTYDYELDSAGYATITGYHGSENYLSIPEEIDGYRVIGIGANIFKAHTELVSVVIPDSVTVIGSSAFENCTNLTEVRMSKKLTDLGSRSFTGTAIDSIEIPKSLNTAENWNAGPFNGCENLKEVGFEEGCTKIPANLFSGCKGLEEIRIPDTVMLVESHAFRMCENLSSVTLSSALTKIETYAFEYCTNLTGINIPDSVTTINTGAFNNCTKLARIEIPDSVTVIGSSAFENCTNLTEVRMSKKLTDLGSRSFTGTAIDSIEIPKSLTTAENWNAGPFNGCENLKEVSFEEGCTKIPANLFSGCKGLEEIRIPDTVTLVESHAFRMCENLSSVTLSSALTKIETYAFEYCTNLTGINIPDSVTTINTGVFNNCTKLARIEIPDSVTVIGSSAFENCTNLTEVRMSKKLTDLGSRSFTGTAIDSIEIPKSLTTAENWNAGPFNGCENLKEVSFEEGYTKIPANLFSGCKGLEEIRIPDTVTLVESHAFRMCENLSSVTLSSALTEIETYAFEYCTNLTEINIPENVATINTGAFNNCTKLPKIEIPDSVTVIGSEAFVDCTSLSEVRLPQNLEELPRSIFQNCGLTSIDIPSTVTTIAEKAFYGCSSMKTAFLNNAKASIGNDAFNGCKELSSIDLGENITKIGNSAFYDCDALTAIKIPNSVTSIGTYSFAECDLLSDVTLGTGMTTIPSSAFYQCQALKNITLPYRVTTVADHAFANCTGLEGITIPRSVTSIDSTVFSYPGKMTIYGVAETYAEQYATEKGIKFVEIDKPATEIALSQTEVTLGNGKTARLNLTITPSDFTDEVSWKSSDTSIATVDDTGLITAKGIGTTTIKVIVGSQSVSCKVEVVQPITGLSLNATSRTMNALETYQLKATTSPSTATVREITWESSAPEVASVDENGLVTAHKKGTTQITVTAYDFAGSISRTCDITVSNTAIIAETVDEMESPHNYLNNCTDFWLYTVDGAEFINVTFDERTEMEDGFDYLYLFDKDGNQIGKYTGKALSGQSFTIAGDTLKVQMNSDDSGNAWGFKVTEIKDAGKPTDPEAEEKEKADKEAANLVADQIRNMDVSNPTSVLEAKKAYDKLTERQKKLLDPALVALLEKALKAASLVPVKTIKITGISNQIAAGKKVQLKANVTPANASRKKMTWKSSNTKVATVTQTGSVTVAKKAGGKSVTITATATDGSKKQATFTIKVMKGAVTKVTVKGAKKTLAVNKTMKLKATVKTTKGKANKKIAWTSSNPKYATVSGSGKVKALKAGKGKKVKITAMATDGSGKKKVVTIKIK